MIQKPIIPISVPSPCHDCKKRHVDADYNCHMHCPEYLAYEKKQGAERERIRKRNLSFVPDVTRKSGRYRR